jgi:signal transduction histidine kinase
MIVLTELPPLPGSRVAALADAAREGLLNVEKHAAARSVVASLFTTRGGVAVTVSDDGSGLAGDPNRSGGLGLAAASDRVARIGGNLTISTNEDGGVTLHAWVPR